MRGGRRHGARRGQRSLRQGGRVERRQGLPTRGDGWSHTSDTEGRIPGGRAAIISAQPL